MTLLFFKKKTSSQKNKIVTLLFFSILFCNLSFAIEKASLKINSFLNKIEFKDTLTQSNYWPNITPDKLIENLNEATKNPKLIYQGRGTNFCGYAAFTFILLQNDGEQFTQFMIELYKYGKANFNKEKFEPSIAVRNTAGNLKYKGILDIHPAEQMWFLTLADHFKGYLNVFNKHYNIGDEDRFWASVNYGKFNRMLKKLSSLQIKSRGSDMIRPNIDKPFEYICQKMETGIVALYINNRILHKKNHNNFMLQVPTHFLIVKKISQLNQLITLTFWDYGKYTQIQITSTFLRKILFGITCCSKINTNA